MPSRILILLVLLITACGKPAPPASEQAGRQPTTQAKPAPTEPPTAISHGEAAIGPPLTAPDRAADAPPPSKQRHQQIRFVTAHVRHEVAPGVVYDA